MMAMLRSYQNVTVEYSNIETFCGILWRQSFNCFFRLEQTNFQMSKVTSKMSLCFLTTPK